MKIADVLDKYKAGELDMAEAETLCAAVMMRWDSLL